MAIKQQLPLRPGRLEFHFNNFILSLFVDTETMSGVGNHWRRVYMYDEITGEVQRFVTTIRPEELEPKHF
jgi:hypothetical protein